MNIADKVLIKSLFYLGKGSLFLESSESLGTFIGWVGGGLFPGS